MSSHDGNGRSRITGHTGPDGGMLDAHTEGMGAPGPHEGPMDGTLAGFHEHDEGGDGPPRSPRARMAPNRGMTPGARPSASRPSSTMDGRSMAGLLRELSAESGNLVRQEVALAKAELREKVHVFSRSMVSIGIGGALMLAALLTGLWALNSGLTSLLAQFLDLEIAVWLSPLILTVALAAGGWMMIRGATERMAREGLIPRRTTTTLREDKRWAQAKVHEIKEELTHGR